MATRRAKDGKPREQRRTPRARHAAARSRRRYAASQRAYDRCVADLATLDIPVLRAGCLELMAGYMDAMSGLETRDEITEAQYEAACVLRQIAASERGWVLIPAEGPGEDYGFWLQLATEWDHRRRAAVLTQMRDELPAGPFRGQPATMRIVSRVLAQVADTERAVAPAAPVMMP